MKQKEKIRKSLTKKRVNLIKNCENCGKEFEVTIIENGVNKTKKCCSLSCSSSLSNKNRKK